MQIRKCLETDIINAGKFYDSVVRWLDNSINYPRWILRVYPSEESVRAMTKNGSQYICLDGEKIIAAFALNTRPQGCYWKGQWKREINEGSYMVLHALAVDPGDQRHGTGSEIIRFCVDQAKLQGCSAIRLDVVPDNIPAIALFEKNGFTYAGDADLELNVGNIPFFSLYELNW